MGPVLVSVNVDGGCAGLPAPVLRPLAAALRSRRLQPWPSFVHGRHAGRRGEYLVSLVYARCTRFLMTVDRIHRERQGVFGGLALALAAAPAAVVEPGKAIRGD